MRKVKGILVLLIIINIALLLYIIFGVEPIHEFTYEEYRISQEGVNPKLEAELRIRIYPENKEFLDKKYVGNLDLNYVYEKLHDLVHKNMEVLQKDLKGLNATALNTYFENNRANLKAIAGITNVQELSNLKQSIDGKDLNDSNYINSEILQEIYEESEKYDTVNLKLNYQNDITLYFKLYIANDMLTSPMVIFEAINGGAE